MLVLPRCRRIKIPKIPQISPNLQASGRLWQHWGTEWTGWGQREHTWDKGQWVRTPRWDPVQSPPYCGLVTKLTLVTSLAPVTGDWGETRGDNPAWEERGDGRSSRSTLGCCVTVTWVVPPYPCAQGRHHHQVLVRCVPVSPHPRARSPCPPVSPHPSCGSCHRI